jgi:hypothetical protein
MYIICRYSVSVIAMTLMGLVCLINSQAQPVVILVFSSGRSPRIRVGDLGYVSCHLVFISCNISLCVSMAVVHM